MITIVIPCYNEENFIEACLSSVLDLEVPAGQEVEVLVIDGGSTDRTLRLVDEKFGTIDRIEVIDNPRRTQSSALNIGVRRSRGEWIARLDAHCTYFPDYLLRCHEAAIATGAQNVGGFCVTEAGGSSYQASLVQALSTHRFGVGNSGFRVGACAGERDTVPFGFFPRALFDRLGGFDERLVRTQDYEFNRRIRKAGGRVYFDPRIRARYFSLPDLRSLLRKQVLTQGPYTAYMWYLAPYAFSPRHAATAALVLFLLFGALFSAASSLVWGGYRAILVCYAGLAMIAAVQQAKRYRRARHLWSLPPAFFLFHLCHGLGVLSGLARLTLRRAPVSHMKSEPTAKEAAEG